jgi:hypothetical protein
VFFIVDNDGAEHPGFYLSRKYTQIHDRSLKNYLLKQFVF